MPFVAGAIAAVTSVVAGAASFIGGLGAIGQAAVGIGLNLAASALRGSFGSQDAPATGVEFDVQTGEGGPRVVRCGRFAVAGHLVYDNQYGSGGRQYQQVFQVSDFLTTSLDRVWVNGELAVLGNEDPVRGRVLNSGDAAGRIWFKFRDGRQTEADQWLIDTANPSERWTSDHVGLGISDVIVTMSLDRERLPRPPEFFFECSGAPLYDFRKDSSVGGNGSHRFDDVSTWEFSENPVLMQYNYQRGFSINDDLFCGMEVGVSDLPISQWAVAANICDENFNAETRYRAAIGMDAGSEHATNIEGLTSATGGMIVNSVDGTYPLIGTNQPIVATLTDDDLIADTQVRFQRLRPMNELANSVFGTFPDPDNQWSPAGYESALAPLLVATDRRTRDVSLNFNTVPYPTQAAQLAAIYLSENRVEATAQITVKPRWQVLEPGDWIEWQSEMYGTRTYMVTDASIASIDSDGPRNTSLSLQERDGSIYDSVGVILPPPTPSPSLAPIFQQELQNFAVVGSTVVGDGGAVVPAIRVSWSAPNDPTIVGAVIEYRLLSAPSDVFSVQASQNQTVRLLTEGVVALSDYEVRHRIITDPARVTAPSAWIPVSTLDIIQDDVSVALGNLQPDVSNVLIGQNQAVLNLDARLEQVAADMSVIALRVLEQRGRENVVELNTDRDLRRIASGVADARLAISGQSQAISSLETSTVLLQEGIETNGAAITSVSSQVEALGSGLSGQATALNSLETSVTSLNGEIEATASSITGVEASIETVEGNLSAGGLLQFSANANPTGGAAAQIDILARAEQGGEAFQTGLSLRVSSDGSVRDIVIDANRFIVTDGEMESNPLLFQNGELVSSIARFQTAIAEGFSTPRGKIFFGERGEADLFELLS